MQIIILKVGVNEKMIRPFVEKDLESVAQIWLSSNITAHWFIPSSYWQSHYEEVKQLLPQATLWVFEDKAEIQGFIGLTEQMIAGLFVAADFRCRGVGKRLLDHVKNFYDNLALQVYRKNVRALHFYLREGFLIGKEQVDPETGQTEYIMYWKKSV